MNTNILKKFARESRKKLLAQVSAKLDYVLKTDTEQLRAKQAQIEQIKRTITKLGKEFFIETVAYTWFNRFTALRYMDLNNHTFMKIVSPLEGFTLPEILSEAKNGYIDEKLKIDSERINKILDGQIPVLNSQAEAYKMLLTSACNYYSSVMPFLFEKIEDFTELLLPDDLLSENSVLMQTVKNMTEEDCRNVEIIGWLYQFYISEKKDEVINAKKRYKKEEIPAATQLFTPHWIVKYLVQNTLGRLWLEARPNSKLKDYMEFYIDPTDKDKIPARSINSPEEITFLDPASGSAHILVYAFELFTLIYEEEGYDKTEIPKLILEKNLFGLEIDERAATLGSFALTMKAADYHKRYLRNPIEPKIFVFEESEEIPLFKNAKTLGSLIRVTKEDYENIKVDETDLFSKKKLKDIAWVLSNKFDCVATNPPYVNSSYMNNIISDFVEEEYKETKADLFACFLIKQIEITVDNGFIGIVTPFTWMFLKAFQPIRNVVLDYTSIESLVKPSYTAFFESAIVPLNSFVLRNKYIQDFSGVYFDLDFLGNAAEQEPRFLSAIKSDNSQRKFTNQNDSFKVVPGWPISYWVTDEFRALFTKYEALQKFADLKTGLVAGNNEKYFRYWFEISQSKIGFNYTSEEQTIDKAYKYVPLNHGGDKRKWYGNHLEVVEYYNNAELMRREPNSMFRNSSYYFKKGINWNRINSGNFLVRISKEGFIYDDVSPSCFPHNNLNYYSILAYLNTKVVNFVMKVLNSGFKSEVGLVSKIPIQISRDNRIEEITKNCIKIANLDWDLREVSWDFKKNELIRYAEGIPSGEENSQLQYAYNEYCNYWREQFFQLHKNEEELNRIFIEIYGLLEELTPDVDLKDITILKQETKISEDGKLEFNKDEIIEQFISYSVGCMFGRYSLDKEGLVLVNQGETLEDYLKQVPNPTFQPDEDAIIPVLEDEYFTDDIVGRFREFLRVAFGSEHYEENILFVEEALGKDIRKYFSKDFYKDHIQRYKKRPIYWMFSSPKKSFNVLIYMHRYKTDTVSKILNDYLREFQEKLKAKKQHLSHIISSEDSKPAEKTKAQKEINKIENIESELNDYERDILRPLSQQRLPIDLDDGVKVNYNKFGEALQKVAGLSE